MTEQTKRSRGLDVIETARKWVLNDSGSAEPAGSSFDEIEFAIADSMGLSRREVRDMMNWY